MHSSRMRTTRLHIVPAVQVLWPSTRWGQSYCGLVLVPLPPGVEVTHACLNIIFLSFAMRSVIIQNAAYWRIELSYQRQRDPMIGRYILVHALKSGDRCLTSTTHHPLSHNYAFPTSASFTQTSHNPTPHNITHR